jgi:nucleotide-binding universal stress UspA family protein
MRHYEEKLKVLYASGGSECSYRAIKGSARIVKNLGAHVTLLTVEDPRRKVDVPKVQKEVDSILKRYNLETVKKVRKGVPAKEILKESKHYDYLIIGSHGLTHAFEKLLGGDAEHIVENLNTSTLVVREEKISKILVCVNLPRYRKELIRTAIEFAKAAESPIEFLHVIPEALLYPIRVERTSAELKSVYEERAEVMENIVKMAEKEGVKASSVFREGVPEEEILLEVYDKKFDLIVVGDSKIRGILAELMGSLSAHIVKESPVSVLVVK